MVFLMKLINRIVFLVISFINMIILIIENKFIVELNKKSVKNIFINDSGREVIIVVG